MNGTALITLRKARNLSQKGLALHLGVTRATVNRCEQTPEAPLSARMKRRLDAYLRNEPIPSDPPPKRKRVGKRGRVPLLYINVGGDPSKRMYWFKETKVQLPAYQAEQMLREKKATLELFT